MAEKKKILYIVEAMGGGVFTYIVDLANELVNKYDMYIAYAVRKQTPKNYKDYFDKRIHLIEVKNFGRAINPTKDIAAFFEVKKIAAEVKPDVIHLHSSKAGAIGRVAFDGKIPMFYTPHGYSFLMENCNPTKRRVFKLIESVCAKRNCTTISCSVGEHQETLKLTKNAAYVNNGINMKELQEIVNQTEKVAHGKVKRADLNIPEDAFVVGMVGRISPQKAPDVFVRMAKLVKDEVPNAHFVIVGSGNQEAEVRQYAEDNGFEDSLHITGWVNDPMSYVELFDIACLLSRWEGFGLVLPEYMMAEKPIVATCVDAIPNIVRNEENGLLVEVDNAAEASEAVIRLYRNAKFKQNLVIQGIKDVHSKFDAQRVAKEHEKLFEELVR